MELKEIKNKITEAKNSEDNMVCGLCKYYDSDMCFCEKHPEYGELVEMDCCQDYEEGGL